jgi:hypothetical protein
VVVAHVLVATTQIKHVHPLAGPLLKHKARTLTILTCTLLIAQTHSIGSIETSISNLTERYLSPLVGLVVDEKVHVYLIMLSSMCAGAKGE